jgi:hypothetical protein
MKTAFFISKDRTASSTRETQKRLVGIDGEAMRAKRNGCFDFFTDRRMS